MWPEVPIRSAMMFEAIEIINKLFTGEVVRHTGKYFTLERAKLYTRPPDDQRVPIYVATAGPVNAKKTGKFADGHHHGRRGRRQDGDDLGQVRGGPPRGRQGPGRAPKLLQIHISWAPTEEEAIENAMVEWPNGGMAFFPKQDIKNPEDFDGIAKLVRPEDFKNRVLISSDLEAHTKHIQHYVDMGYDEIHLHNVGRNQAEFIEVFGQRRPAEPAPGLGRPAATRGAPGPTIRRRGRAPAGSVVSSRRRRVATVSCQPGGTSRGRGPRAARARTAAPARSRCGTSSRFAAFAGSTSASIERASGRPLDRDAVPAEDAAGRGRARAGPSDVARGGRPRARAS